MPRACQWECRSSEKISLILPLQIAYAYEQATHGVRKQLALLKAKPQVD
jgi:hypothetical protein